MLITINEHPYASRVFEVARLACSILKLDNIVVDIYLTSDNDGASGWAMCLDDDEYEISIDDTQNLSEIERATIHELVHVWQYFTNQLVFDGSRTWWDGVVWTNQDQPWERQAEVLEDFIYERYV